VDPPCQEVDGRPSPLVTSSAISITTLLEDDVFFVEFFQPLDPHSLRSKSFDTLNKDGDWGCLKCADFDCSPIIQAGVVDILLQKDKEISKGFADKLSMDLI
jgi:hypothetical protein